MAGIRSRKRTSDLGAGGYFGFTWEHFAVDGSFTRITAHDPLGVADGEAGIFLSPLALCEGRRAVAR